MFYSRLSIGIAIVNKESFENFLRPDCDSDRHKNLPNWSLGRAPPSKKIYQNFFRYFAHGHTQTATKT